MPLQKLSEASIYFELTDFTPAWQPDKPTLMFIHGLNSSHAHWFNQVPVFARRFPVLTVDLRGHGASSAPATGYTVGHHTDDLSELLNTLEINEIIPIGASLGGCIAQQLAVRMPSQVKAIIAGGSCARVPKELDMAAFQPMIEQMGFENFLREMLPQATFNPDVDPGLVKFVLDIALANKTEIIMQRTAEGFMYDDLEAAQRIACPALVLMGENDNTTPRHCSEELKAAIPNSSLAIIPACGHLPHLEAPGVYNEIVSRFLDKLN